MTLYCNTVNSCFFSTQFARLVGAGLALPSFHNAGKIQGQGKPSPYESRLVAVPPPCAFPALHASGAQEFSADSSKRVAKQFASAHWN